MIEREKNHCRYIDEKLILNHCLVQNIQKLPF
jgi:hypothetical protein